MGRITKPHGLRGEVVVKLVTDRVERLQPGTRLASDGRDLEIVTSRPHQDGWLVVFSGVTSREEADELRGVRLLAPPLEDPDVLWVHELVDAEVVDVAGRHHGRVVAVEANPASDLLVLDDDRLVPLTFVVEHRPGSVTIDPPAGLLD